MRQHELGTQHTTENESAQAETTVATTSATEITASSDNPLAVNSGSPERDSLERLLQALAQKGSPDGSLSSHFFTQLQLYNRDLSPAAINDLKTVFSNASQANKKRFFTAYQCPILPAKTTPTVEFSDADLINIFNTLLEIPASHRQESNFLDGLRPSAGSSAYLNPTYTSGKKIDRKGTAIIKTADTYGPEFKDKDVPTMVSQSVWHEIGHRMDTEAHPGDARNGATFHQNHGWTAYAKAEDIVALLPLDLEGVPESQHKSYTLSAINIINSILASESIATMLTNLDDKLAGDNVPAFHSWFAKQELLKAMRGSVDLLAPDGRYRAGGNQYFFHSFNRRFYRVNEATTHLDTWKNTKAAFAPLEWAAELYVTWFSGDGEPGSTTAAQGFASDIKEWLKGIE